MSTYCACPRLSVLLLVKWVAVLHVVQGHIEIALAGAYATLALQGPFLRLQARQNVQLAHRVHIPPSTHQIVCPAFRARTQMCLALLTATAALQEHFPLLQVPTVRMFAISALQERTPLFKVQQLRQLVCSAFLASTQLCHAHPAVAVVRQGKVTLAKAETTLLRILQMLLIFLLVQASEQLLSSLKQAQQQFVRAQLPVQLPITLETS